MNRKALLDKMVAHHPGYKFKGTPGMVRGNVDAKDVTVDRSGRNRDILVRANTAAIDCDDEVVVPEGAQLDYIAKNRKVFLDHWYGYEDSIGGIRSGFPKLVDGVWFVQFGVSRCEKGEKVLNDAEDFGVGVSIGFDALDAGPPTDEELERYGGGKSFSSIVRKWHWIELSVTAMPCNVECQSVPEVAPKSKRWTLTPFGVIANAE